MMTQQTVRSEAEPIAEAIRTHEAQTGDWAFREAAARLNDLFDALNERFFGGQLPKAVLSIGPDLIVRYGYYRIGRDDIGVRHRIHLNSRHFGRSESDVGVTLLHEMIHVHQHLYGDPGHRSRYHNKEFVDIAAVFGIETRIGNGTTLSVGLRLRKRLQDWGFSETGSMITGIDADPIRRPLRKVMWRCGCRDVWVDRGVPIKAMCLLCGHLLTKQGTDTPFSSWTRPVETATEAGGIPGMTEAGI